MKKLARSTLLMAFLLALMAVPAFAGADTYPYLTFEDSQDFTVVAPRISYEVIRAVGLDANFVKHDISDPENITWTTSNQNVAFIIPVEDTVYVVCLNEGTATVTASYTCADNTVITCSSNVVVERRSNPVNMVNNVSVTIKEIPPLGNPPNFDISRSSQDNPADPINVPLFSLTSIWPGIDDDDVLTKDPTALHALLYTLEVELDDDNYLWGEQGWDWDWVPNNVTLQFEGSYVYQIGAHQSGWPTGWKFKVNDTEYDIASSIVKINSGDKKVDWAFTDDWQP
ncbi:MAG: hypothetical protein K6T66_02360 [Peptococcaceae bacterium]|nr:hypothetical protein [Peptococcaceae bacterium]